MVARWVVTRIGGDKYPKPGESKIDTTGAGAGCAPGRGGVLAVGARGGGGSWWGRSFLWVRGVVLWVVALSPWWWAWVGGGAFPLVASGGGVGVGFGCGQ